MIKTIFHTAALLSLLLWGADLFASGREEAVASWEREAGGRIWSERVIADALSDSGEKMPLNALCDETAFETIRSLRARAVSLLQDAAGGNGDGDGYSFRLYAGILKNISKIDITSLKDHERELLIGLSSLPHSVSLKDCLSPGKRQRDEIASTPPPPAATNPRVVTQNVKINNALTRKRAEVQDLSHNVNLREYSVRAGKIDLYTLYLYIWEDNPFPGGSARIQLLPVFPPLPLIHTPPHHTTEISLHISVHRQSCDTVKGAPSCFLI
jgi:hypothetical protein